jgi:cytochrome c-type biogenesis protein CcmH
MTDQVQTLTQQIQKLRALHAQGVIGDAELHKSCAPLERQLVDLVLSAPATAVPAHVGRKLTAMLVAGVVALGAAGYLWTGSPGTPAQPFASRTDTAPAPQAGGNSGSNGAAPEIGREQILAMTEKLTARLKDTPDDVEGWRMLGRAQMALEQPVLAVQAYQRVAQLLPKDAGALADYADALAVRNGRELQGEPLQLVEQALKLDPSHMKALILAGTAAYNRGDFAKAVVYWDRAGQVGPPDNPLAQQARAAAAEAREAGKVAPPSATGTAPAATGGPAGVSGTVSLAAALRARVSPDDTVFIVARPSDGSRMPLAILRKQVRDLPFRFTLDDSQAMSPAGKLSSAKTVIVVARISKSGQASPQPGDLEGITAPVAVGSSGVVVEISREVAAPAQK